MWPDLCGGFLPSSPFAGTEFEKSWQPESIQQAGQFLAMLEPCYAVREQAISAQKPAGAQRVAGRQSREVARLSRFKDARCAFGRGFAWRPGRDASVA